MLNQTCVFASSGICGSRSALVCLGHKTSMHYFSCLSEASVVSIKSASVHATPNLCFCIQWDIWVMYMKRRHSFHALVGPV
jgi:hypothetical protein